jgi:MFS family permease
MLSLMLGFGVVSRLASGLIADRIGGVATLIIGSTLQCLALLFYIPFDGLASLYIVSSLFGLAQGGIVPSYALIIRDYFPAREAGLRISLVLTATVVGMALGGWLSGEIFDYTGSYRMAFLNGIGWNIVNLAIAAWGSCCNARRAASHALKRHDGPFIRPEFSEPFCVPPIRPTVGQPDPETDRPPRAPDHQCRGFRFQTAKALSLTVH